MQGIIILTCKVVNEDEGEAESGEEPTSSTVAATGGNFKCEESERLQSVFEEHSFVWRLLFCSQYFLKS